MHSCIVQEVRQHPPKTIPPLRRAAPKRDRNMAQQPCVKLFCSCMWTGPLSPCQSAMSWWMHCNQVLGSANTVARPLLSRRTLTSLAWTMPSTARWTATTTTAHSSRSCRSAAWSKTGAGIAPPTTMWSSTTLPASVLDARVLERHVRNQHLVDWQVPDQHVPDSPVLDRHVHDIRVLV